MSVIIDRRLNDRDKSASNRERFMRRYKRHIRRAVADMIDDRPIKDVVGGGKVRIPVRDIAEPTWRHGEGGARDIVLPGNREFMPGDQLQRPEGGASGGGGDDEGGGGDGSDDFVFTLSRDEFLSIFFDDLELPNMMRTETGDITEMRSQRAGYATDGAQSNLAVLRTMRQALARRIALRAPLKRRLRELEEEEEDDGDDAPDDVPGTLAPEDEREALRRRIAATPWLDDVDLRFRRRTQVPRPMSQAVMFCLMDVSASMDKHRKDLAKRFYTLLYLFLSRKYERVEIVFIRHTDHAQEVDEDHFFNDRQTGGTTVLPALKLMSEIVADRYSPREWNIYAAQASDGDAFGVDPEKSRRWLEAELLPAVRHFAYVEVGGPGYRRPSALARAYQRLESPRFAMVKAGRRRDIYPVFRQLFEQRAKGVGGGVASAGAGA